MSNLFGGIGYFYGSSIVKSNDKEEEDFEYGPRGLLTSTPSRHQFPRGFMWDEGFHLLVTSTWDTRLALTILSHWLDLMNAHGWIPREQILGFEARSRVPAEFLVQSDKIANPPALILTIESILDRKETLPMDEWNEFIDWCDRALPRLHKWYQWFNSTQTGPKYSSYRWHGRSGGRINVLNPLTLSSGLDDYPRASHPSDDEMHLDLRCWMTAFSKVLFRITELLQKVQSKHSYALTLQISSLYKSWSNVLEDEALLNELHWSSGHSRYADFGYHTDAVSMVQIVEQNNVRWVRKEDDRPRLQHITSANGYLSLLPIALKVLSPKSSNLPIILSELRNEKTIWTQFGLRSLSKTSQYYLKRNSEHEQPYWRGAIWINMNYLVMHGLNYYAQHPNTPKQVAERAASIARELRRNVFNNVIRQFNDTGFLWEQYNDSNGKGQRAHPFSGWTTLAALMLT